MRYLFFARHLLTKVGGVEVAAWNLAREFHKDGKEIVIVTGKGDKIIPYPELQEFVYAVDYKPAAKQFRLLGRGLAKILEMRSLANAAQEILAHRAQETAYIYFKPAAIWGLKRFLKPGSKACLHSQGVDCVFGDKPLSRKYTTHFSACSNFNAWQMQSHFKRPVAVIQNAVPESFLTHNAPADVRDQWRAKIDTPSDARVFAFAGRMTQWKGLGLFIKAFAKVKDPKNILWLVGEGDALEGWLELAKSLGVADRVRHHSFIPHVALPDLWSSADVGVFPSQGDEAFGISIAEAMACAKPIIGSAFAGIPEVVGNEGSCGWLCSHGNVDEYAQAIEQAAQSNLAQMGQAARARVGQLFTWPQQSQKLLAYLDS